ncbi:methyltransferase [Litorimonas cladophorae]|uniref:Methyltransferase n=1 Tax=Litorimonas cladophorae TaxID=1220491 RepID=A0A918KHT4_9PROT|nr:16S rRNA (guanine(966)-N(2))-methyltransferase RsmD [Litorimonas cladophorae]GGX61423.1 methyltransferase [Litorimonas cladophorae]
MRIVSGSLRGRNIDTPTGKTTRPTSDQTRESIFNILSHATWSPPLEGAIIADIFAGSGALGLEGISRGAAFCLFAEMEPKARASIRNNINKMGLNDVARLHRYDARKLKIAPGNLRGPFTHIFMDPPYNKDLWKPVLRRLVDQNLLAENGVIILEESIEAEVEPRGFEVLADKTWGAARVLFLKPSA